VVRDAWLVEDSGLRRSMLRVSSNMVEKRALTCARRAPEPPHLSFLGLK
jgi:hypothetical protein